MPKTMTKVWITDFSYREQSLYPQLCYIAYLLNAISPNNTFVADLKRLIEEHPSVQIQQLVGFPHNWEQEPLWSKKPY